MSGDTKRTIIDTLLHSGALSQDDATTAAMIAEARNVPLTDILREEQIVAESVIDEAIAEQTAAPSFTQLPLLQTKKLGLVHSIAGLFASRKKSVAPTLWPETKQESDSIMEQWHQRQRERIARWRTEQDRIHLQKRQERVERQRKREEQIRLAAEAREKKRLEKERIRKQREEEAKQKAEELRKKAEEARERKEELHREKANEKRERLRERIRRREEIKQQKEDTRKKAKEEREARRQQKIAAAKKAEEDRKAAHEEMLRKKHEEAQRKIFEKKMRAEDSRKEKEEKRRRYLEERKARKSWWRKKEEPTVILAKPSEAPHKTEQQIEEEARDEAKRQFFVAREMKRIAKLMGGEKEKEEPREIIITSPVSIRTLPPDQAFTTKPLRQEPLEKSTVENTAQPTTQSRKEEVLPVRIQREVVVEKVADAMTEEERATWKKKLQEEEKKAAEALASLERERMQNDALHRELRKQTDTVTEANPAVIAKAVQQAREEERKHWEEQAAKMKETLPSSHNTAAAANKTTAKNISEEHLQEAIHHAKEEERAYWEQAISRLKKEQTTTAPVRTETNEAALQEAAQKARDEERKHWEAEVKRMKLQLVQGGESSVDEHALKEAVEKAKDEERRHWEKEVERVRDEARRDGGGGSGGISSADLEDAVSRAREQERRSLERERQDLEDQRHAMERAKTEASSSDMDAMSIAQKIVMEEKERMETRMQKERDRWADEKRHIQASALKGTSEAMEKKTGIELAEEESLKKQLAAERSALERAQMSLEEDRKRFEKEKEMLRTANREVYDDDEEEDKKKEVAETREEKKEEIRKEKKKKIVKKEGKEQPKEDLDVGKILLEQNYISQEEYQKSKEDADERHIPIDIALKEMGLITKELMQNAIAEYYKIPFYDLRSKPPDAATVEIIPEDTAVALGAVAVSKKEDGTLVIATNHPERTELLDDLKEVLPEIQKIELVYASREGIESSLTFYRKPLDTRFRRIIERQKKVAPEIIEEIFIDAIQLGASDIHFEPQEKIVMVRFRVDGVMHEAGRIPKEYFEGIVNRIKIASNMRIDEHYAAQDGAIRWKHGNNYMDVRVSIVPIVDGEKIVMRLLSEFVRTLTLSDLGFTSEQQEVLLKAAYKPFGMILTTGPTGSGKSTTLYGCLKIRNTPDVNISTIEDPVEYKIPGINHIQVNEKTGLSFEKGLRAIVRQDPDVVLVGEIRDAITAQISVNAALTGHLLFSTLHANDAATAIPRLVEMGIEPYLLASTLEVIIAQRLLRRICTHCRYSYRITEKEAYKLFANAHWYFTDKGEVTLFKGRGCKFCGNTGFKGRLGIYELMQVTPELEELIVQNATSADLNEVSRAQGLKMLFEDGLEKALAGMTSIEELLRIAAPPEKPRLTIDEAMTLFHKRNVS